MAVTADKYELPKAIADTVDELSAMTGVSRAVIYSAISKNSSGKYSGLKFVRVEIDEGEEDDT